jgi:hypothetical protein
MKLVLRLPVRLIHSEPPFNVRVFRLINYPGNRPWNLRQGKQLDGRLRPFVGQPSEARRLRRVKERTRSSSASPVHGASRCDWLKRCTAISPLTWAQEVPVIDLWKPVVNDGPSNEEGS